VLTQRQSVTGSRAILTTLEETQAAALQVAQSAARLLTIYTQDLEPQVYDRPLFLETIKRLILGKSYAKVRVLVVDPGRVMHEASKFVGLARRITSHIEIRHAHPDHRSNASAFLIADDRALLYRLQAARWDGICEMSDPSVARRYLTFFDEVWQASNPDRETRELRL